MEKRKTPLMGWSSWNALHTDINEENLKEQADLLVDLGLKDLGYTYLNIDDGFFGGRDNNGKLRFRKDKFPNGLKSLVDYIHSKGLKAGIYSDGGDSTCASFYDGEGENGKNVGLYNHEKEDLKLFFKENDFDFIKVDWCGGLRLGLDEKEQYTKISKIINSLSDELDKDLIFNICRWQFPGPWATKTADSWRIGGDIIPEFESILYQLDTAKPLYKYQNIGHVNDLDMLEVGNGMNLIEDKTHFALWCLMSTPLIIGTDLRTIKPDRLEILKDKELIEINQDPASLPAYVIKRLEEDDKIVGEVFLKDLKVKDSPEKVIALLNRSEKPLTLEIDLDEAGFSKKILSIRNISEHKDLKVSDSLKADLNPHEIAVFKVKAESSKPVKNLDEKEDFVPVEYKYITEEELSEKQNNGAVLIDVRTPDEFKEGHLEGAINIPYFAYQEFVKEAEKKDLKDKEIILTCRTGKRASQAYQILKYFGFNNLSILKK